MTESTERAAFEADAAPMGFDLTRQSIAVPEPWAEYADEHTGHRWAGWLARASLAEGKAEDALNHAYAEGRADEREALAQICVEEAARIRKEGEGCTDARYDWMAQGIEAVADTFRGIDSATGRPFMDGAVQAATSGGER